MGSFNIDPGIFVSLLKKFCVAKTAKEKIIHVLTMHCHPKGIVVKQSDDSDTMGVLAGVSPAIFSLYPIKEKESVTFETTEIIKDVPKMFKKVTSIEFKWTDEKITISGGDTELDIPDVYADEKSLLEEPKIVEGVDNKRVPIYGDEIVAQFYIDATTTNKTLSVFSSKSIDFMEITCEGNLAVLNLEGKRKGIRKKMRVRPEVKERITTTLPIKYMMLSLSSLEGEILVTIDNQMYITLSELTDKYYVHHILMPVEVEG